VPGYADPQNLNRYSYVTNDPLKYTDPTGHRPEEGYVGNHGPLNCKKYSEYCNNGKPKSADEIAKIRNKPDNGDVATLPSPTLTPSTGAQQQSPQPPYWTLHRVGELGLGIVGMGLGVAVTLGGFAITAAAVAEAIEGVATGPGELLIAPHAMAVGSVALFVVVPVGVTVTTLGYQRTKDALRP